MGFDRSLGRPANHGARGQVELASVIVENVQTVFRSHDGHPRAGDIENNHPTSNYLVGSSDAGHKATTSISDVAAGAQCPIQESSELPGAAPEPSGTSFCARCQGHMPVSSTSRLKLKNVRTSTMPANTATDSSVGLTATVRMMSAATRSFEAEQNRTPDLLPKHPIAVGRTLQQPANRKNSRQPDAAGDR
jgi:hypothetical protein